jgi:hypothetical protein
MSALTLSETAMLSSAAAWKLTFAEEAKGWPGQWTLVWRCEEFHGKIGTFVKAKSKPTAARIKKALKQELIDRLRSPLRCDAKRVAYLWLQKNGAELPAEIDTAKILQDALYDLDAKIAGEFFSSEPPRLFMTTTHGWILGEIAEIRCLVSHVCAKLDKAEGRDK